MLSAKTLHAARSLVDECIEKGLRIASAESCSAGLIAAGITSVPGSSAMYWGGWVVYDNDAKLRLGVDAAVLTEHGAVSRECAMALAARALELSKVDIAVSVTGIAGPGGGSADKPVGTVWFGLAKGRTLFSGRRHFDGSRSEIREAAVATAYDIMLDALRHEAPTWLIA